MLGAADGSKMNSQFWTIGSDPASDLVVERPSVSWRHCRLTPAPKRGRFSLKTSDQQMVRMLTAFRFEALLPCVATIRSRSV